MMNEDLLKRAAWPGVYHLRSDALLRDMSAEAREQAEAALTAALVRPAALELADALEAKLQEAREAAVEPTAAVAAAKKALAQEQTTIAGRLAAFWKSRANADPDDHTRPPEQETPEVASARAALAAAEAEAEPFLVELRYREEQIAGLRACPGPDPAVLAVLAAALKGARDGAD